MGYPFKVGTEFWTDQCVTDHSPRLCRFIDNFFYLIRMTDKGTRWISISVSYWPMVALATLSAVSPRESETT